MKNIFRSIETPYIDAQTLLTLLKNHKKPREAIIRMVDNGELIRIKNGIYLIEEKIKYKNETIIPFEQLANFLYGPSYVSMEWALSFYGMIPERVHTITSMTLGRNKEYHTSIGDFSYFSLSDKKFFIGVTQKQSSDFVGGFLIATPEKALADMAFKTCKNLNVNEIKEELLESRRMDLASLENLNRELLNEIAQHYRVKSVDYLYELIGNL